MGWLFSYFNTRAQEIARLRDASRFSEGTTLLKSSMVGNHHWYVAETNGVRWIGLDLIAGGGKSHGYGHKSMDETCGPVAVDCPLSFLDLASEPTGYAIAWRARVRAHHAAKKTRAQSKKPGTWVVYGGTAYQLITPLGRKGWTVRTETGAEYRMKAHQLSRAELRA